MSAFKRHDGGYVDNITTARDDVNASSTEGGRFAALWKLSDSVSLKISALVQDTHGDGSAAVDTNAQLQPLLGDLKQARLPGTEGYSSKVRLYTAKLDIHLGWADFASISSLGTSDYSQIADITGTTGAFAEADPFHVAGATEPNIFHTDKLTQEFRLSSVGNERLEWLTGLFYTHEYSPSHEINLANEVTTGAPVGVLLDYYYPTTVAEYSAFGDLTLHFTNQFDVQLGGRESVIRQSYRETDTGPLVDTYYLVPSPAITPTERTDSSAFTYLVTPRFRVSSDLMLYARFASGYRVGSPNATAALFNLPPKYDPDKTNNYELGIKTELLDHRLSIDASAYYIDWKHIQVYVFNQSFTASYITNGGTASSRGLEASVQWRPIETLKVALSTALNDAKLTEDLPAAALAVGNDGDHLPYSSRFTGTFSADQTLIRAGSLTGYIGGSLSYVGAREGEFASVFTTPPQRLEFPAYARIDLHAAVAIGSWNANIFVNNAANRRGVVGGASNGTNAESPYYVYYIQPRTVGLSLTKEF